MTIEAATLASLLNRLQQWLNASAAKQEPEKVKLRPALRTVYIAAFETRAYLASIEVPGGRRDSETEAKLAQLWRDAGIELRDIDANLAQQCVLADTAWTDLSNSSQPQRDSSRLLVNNAFDTARKILINTHGAGDGGKD